MSNLQIIMSIVKLASDMSFPRPIHEPFMINHFLPVHGWLIFIQKHHTKISIITFFTYTLVDKRKRAGLSSLNKKFNFVGGKLHFIIFFLPLSHQQCCKEKNCFSIHFDVTQNWTLFFWSSSSFVQNSLSHRNPLTCTEMETCLPC